MTEASSTRSKSRRSAGGVRSRTANLSLGAAALATEASAVIPLRLVKIAFGGLAGAAEAQLMVTEKLEANGKLAGKLLTGGLGLTPDAIAQGMLNHYLPYVRANRKRLSGKGKRG